MLVIIIAALASAVGKQRRALTIAALPIVVAYPAYVALCHASLIFVLVTGSRLDVSQIVDLGWS